MAKLTDYTYSTKSNRYHHTATGKFVGRVNIRKEFDKVIDVSGDRMMSWTKSLQSGGLTISEWQANMATEIKMVQMSFGAAANGGWNNMSQNDWDRISTVIAEQYTYLRKFAEDIYTGRQPLNGNAIQRSSLYAESARVTYENERRRIEFESGATEEKNVLGGNDHCEGCLDAEGQGWVDINTLVPIGDRDCLSKCRCTIIYRKGPNDTLGSDLS